MISTIPAASSPDFCGVIDNPCGIVAIPEAIGGRAVADAATPIVAQLAKHKTLLNSWWWWWWCDASACYGGGAGGMATVVW